MNFEFHESVGKFIDYLSNYYLWSRTLFNEISLLVILLLYIFMLIQHDCITYRVSEEKWETF